MWATPTPPAPRGQESLLILGSTWAQRVYQAPLVPQSGCNARAPPPPHASCPPKPRARPASSLGAAASIRRQGRRSPPAPGGSTQPTARAGAAGESQRLRLFVRIAAPAPRCGTARAGASGTKFAVGPSGTERLSVRHVQIHGHAPHLAQLIKKQWTWLWCFTELPPKKVSVGYES
ncbi:hypothetical protein NDU88_006460 [Pleurodeles waltl]|uniref:Uncharacterized protein n=1 Tax=Pleurodeles waltl TaxID=8319 RepID=A0AAV7ULJ5_PLEWA|nr:hypothetical protein NDU88_006460 [Pleurodeles waltl]